MPHPLIPCPSEADVLSVLKARKVITHGDFIFASGIPADTKIEFDHVKNRTPAFSVCMRAMLQKIIELDPDVVVTVPNGANRFAHVLENMATRLDEPRRLTTVMFRKAKGADGQRLFIPFQPPYALRELGKADRVVLVDDVYSLGSTALAMAEHIGIDKVVGVVPVIDRGQDVPGVIYPDDALAYTREHPTEPPAHIGVPYEVRPVVRMPLGFIR